MIGIIYQSTCCDQLLHKLLERLSLIFFAFRAVIDLTTVEIYLDFISGFDLFCSLRAFNDRKSDIDRVSVEDPCKSCDGGY